MGSSSITLPPLVRNAITLLVNDVVGIFGAGSCSASREETGSSHHGQETHLCLTSCFSAEIPRLWRRWTDGPPSWGAQWVLKPARGESMATAHLAMGEVLRTISASRVVINTILLPDGGKHAGLSVIYGVMDPDSDPLGRAARYPRHKPSASGERTIRGAYSVGCGPCNAGYTKRRSLGRGTAEQLCHYVENLPSPENTEFRLPSDVLVYILHREEAGSFAEYSLRSGGSVISEPSWPIKSRTLSWNLVAYK